MIDRIKDRVMQEAQYIYETHSTIRKTAQIYGVSKGTVHNDISKSLEKLEYDLYLSLKEILQENFKQKHIRGGKATKEKYMSNNRGNG